MKNFMRLIVSLVFIGVGACATEFLCAAQQPHKRKQEAEESIAKKPRPEEHEEKTDADREEKEPEGVSDDEDQSSEDSSDSEEEEDYYEPSAQIKSIEIAVRDKFIREYLNSQEYIYCPKSERAWFMQNIDSFLARHLIENSEQARRYLYGIIEAHLFNYIYPMIAHCFDEYILCARDITSFVTPGEFAESLKRDFITNNIKNSLNSLQMIQACRSHGIFNRSHNILQQLQSLNPSSLSVEWLSNLSPNIYKNLFNYDQSGLPQRGADGVAVINPTYVNILIDRDIQIIRSVSQHAEEQRNLDSFVNAFSTMRFDFHHLVNTFGDLRYRLHRVIASLQIPGNGISLINIYRDIIEKYVSSSAQNFQHVRTTLDFLRERFGLRQVPSTRCSRLFDCWVISACCNELIRVMHAAHLDEMLENFVDKIVKFEIQYDANQQLITYLNNKKQLLLDEFSKIKINAFKAYAKALLSLSETAKEIIVNRDDISDPQDMLDDATDEFGVCQKIISIVESWSKVNPITMSYASDNGVDHGGISRTLNTLLARSFSGDLFCTYNNRYTLPKLFSEISGKNDNKDAVFCALGSWLSIIFVNNIAVPLQMPTVFYAGLKNILPHASDRAAVIKWAEYLKNYDENLFNYYRPLFKALLYGTVGDIKGFCRDVIIWDESAYAEFTDENKFKKVLHEIILPIFSLDPLHKDFGQVYECLQNNFLLNGEDKVFCSDSAISRVFTDYLKSESAETKITPAYLEEWGLPNFSGDDPLFQKLLCDLFAWLSPYDLAHFFPQTIDAVDLIAHFEFNKTDIVGLPVLAHAADVFEQALREYINENRDNQEKLGKLVNYFSGSPVYQGQQLKVQFTKNQNYDESAHTCYHTVQINMGTVNSQNVVTNGRALACQSEGDAAFKNTMKELIAAWGDPERFNLEEQLEARRQQAAAAQAALQPI